MNKFQRFITSIACLLIPACSGIQPVSDPEPQADTISIDNRQSEIPSVAVKPLSTDSLYALLVGDFALARNQFKIAQSNYLKQAQKTLDPEVIGLAAKITAYNQDYKALEQMALLWIQQQPTNATPRALAFEALAAQGDAAGALEHASWLYAHNNQLDSFIAITSIPNNQQAIEQLIQALEQLELDKNQQPAILLALAILHRDLDDLIKAQQMAEEFLLAKPMNPLGTLLLSKIYQQQERLAESLQLLATALEKTPTNFELRQQYARFMALTDRSQALEQFELLRKQQPNNQNINFMLALLLLDIGDLKEASRLLMEAAQEPHLYMESQYYLGVIADAVGNADLAIDFYAKVESGQNYLVAISRRATLLAQHQSLATARDYLQSVRTERPNYAIELLTLEANLLVDVDRGELAYQLLSDSLSQFPNHPELLYIRAMVAEQQDNYQQTELDLRKLIALDADNAIALNALGYSMLIHTDRYEEAYQLIKQAYFIDPSDPATTDSMGWALFKLGQPKAALKHLQKAMQMMPDPEIAAHLGEVEWVLGNRDVAIKIWRDGLQQSPRHQTILETIERLSVPIEPNTSDQE